MSTPNRWKRSRRARISLVLAAIAAATLSAAPRVAGHGGSADIVPPSTLSVADGP